MGSLGASRTGQREERPRVLYACVCVCVSVCVPIDGASGSRCSTDGSGGGSSGGGGRPRVRRRRYGVHIWGTYEARVKTATALTRERRDHGWGGVPDHRTDCEIWPGGPGLSASTGQDPNVQSCRRIRICLDMYPHLISPHPSPRPGPGSLTSAPTGPLWRPAAKASEAFRGGGIPGPASISLVLPVSSPHSLPSPRRPPPLPPSPTSRGRRGSSKGEGNKQNWMPGFPS